jgi:hypothetical protein
MRKQRKIKSDLTRMASDIQQGVQMLDKPQATNWRKRNDGHEHQFLLRDRCYWCGMPEDVEPLEPREPIEEDADARSEEEPRRNSDA